MLGNGIGAQKSISSTKVDSTKWARIFEECFAPRVRLLWVFVGHKDRAAIKFKTSCINMIEIMAVSAERKERDNLPVSTGGGLVLKLWMEWNKAKARQA